MPLELAVYRLKSGATEEADEWLKELARYLSRASSGNITITSHDNKHPADALWHSDPFVIVGAQDEAKKFVAQLSVEARQIFDDCAYFWFLSDSDQYCLSPERTIVLSWGHKHFEIIASRLKVLLKYPRLAGLSRGLHKVRLDIERITAGKQGPWSSVLILGQSGTGKEEVANSLYESLDFGLYKNGNDNEEDEESASLKDDPALQLAISEIIRAIQEAFPKLKQKRISPGTNHLQKHLRGMPHNRKNPGKFTALSCKTFSTTLLETQMFGIGNVASNVPAREGLLINNSDGCVFLDDFDTALDLIQEPLLRVMDARENKPAVFYRVGEEGEQDKKRESWVWLLFSTNADIESLVESKDLREDFIFRFKDRILYIPPLNKRPADIPAIAHRIWNSLWKVNDPLKRSLYPLVLQYLVEREKEWKGNVRALQRLLSLAASMVRQSAHNGNSLRQILKEMMDKGPGYKSQLGIITSSSFTAPILFGNSAIREVREMSDESVVEDATSKLTQEGREIFEDAHSKATKRGGGKIVLQGIRLARIISYVARQGDMNKQDWSDLCKRDDVSSNSKPGEGTFDSDMALLAVGNSGKEKKLLKKGNKKGKMDVYERFPGMFA